MAEFFLLFCLASSASVVFRVGDLEKNECTNNVFRYKRNLAVEKLQHRYLLNAVESFQHSTVESVTRFECVLLGKGGWCILFDAS